MQKSDSFEYHFTRDKSSNQNNKKILIALLSIILLVVVIIITLVSVIIHMENDLKATQSIEITRNLIKPEKTEESSDKEETLIYGERLFHPIAESTPGKEGPTEYIGSYKERDCAVQSSICDVSGTREMSDE